MPGGVRRRLGRVQARPDHSAVGVARSVLLTIEKQEGQKCHRFVSKLQHRVDGLFYWCGGGAVLQCIVALVANILLFVGQLLLFSSYIIVLALCMDIILQSRHLRQPISHEVEKQMFQHQADESWFICLSTSCQVKGIAQLLGKYAYLLSYRELDKKIFTPYQGCNCSETKTKTVTQMCVYCLSGLVKCPPHPASCNVVDTSSLWFSLQNGSANILWQLLI